MKVSIYADVCLMALCYSQGTGTNQKKHEGSKMGFQHYTEVNLAEARRRLADSKAMLAAFPYNSHYKFEVKGYQNDVSFYEKLLKERAELTSK